MAFFGPTLGSDQTLGGSSNFPPGQYGQLLQLLTQQFPGLRSLGGGGQPPTDTMAQMGYTSPGINLFSGQGGGQYGGLGLFEGSAMGQPESVTGAIASGTVGRSQSQLPNTGGVQQSSPLQFDPSLTNLSNQGLNFGGIGPGGGQGSTTTTEPGQPGTTVGAGDLFSAGKNAFNAYQTLFPNQQGTQPTTPGFPEQRAGERADLSQANYNLPQQNIAQFPGLTQGENALSSPAVAQPQVGQVRGDELSMLNVFNPGGAGATSVPTFAEAAAQIPPESAGGIAELATGGTVPTAEFAGTAGAGAGGIGADVAGMTGAELGAGLAGETIGAETLSSLAAAAGMSSGTMLSMLLGPLSGMIIGAAMNPLVQAQQKLQNNMREVQGIQKDFGTAYPVVVQGLEMPVRLQQALVSNDPQQLAQIVNMATSIFNSDAAINRAMNVTQAGPFKTGIDPIPWLHQAYAGAADAYGQAMARLQQMGAIQDRQPTLAQQYGGAELPGGPNLYVGNTPIQSGAMIPSQLQAWGANPQVAQQYTQVLGQYFPVDIGKGSEPWAAGISGAGGGMGFGEGGGGGGGTGTTQEIAAPTGTNFGGVGNNTQSQGGGGQSALSPSGIVSSGAPGMAPSDMSLPGLVGANAAMKNPYTSFIGNVLGLDPGNAARDLVDINTNNAVTNALSPFGIPAGSFNINPAEAGLGKLLGQVPGGPSLLGLPGNIGQNVMGAAYGNELGVRGSQLGSPEAQQYLNDLQQHLAGLEPGPQMGEGQRLMAPDAQRFYGKLTKDAEGGLQSHSVPGSVAVGELPGGFSVNQDGTITNFQGDIVGHVGIPGQGGTGSQGGTGPNVGPGIGPGENNSLASNPVGPAALNSIMGTGPLSGNIANTQGFGPTASDFTIQGFSPIGEGIQGGGSGGGGPVGFGLPGTAGEGMYGGHSMSGGFGAGGAVGGTDFGGVGNNTGPDAGPSQSFYSGEESATPPGEGDAGGGGGGAGGKVICTELHRQGKMDETTWLADECYAKTIPREVAIGYRTWGEPLVRLMRRSRVITWVVSRFAHPWAHEMAHRMGARSRGSIPGCVIMAVMTPLCAALGRRRLAHIRMGRLAKSAS